MRIVLILGGLFIACCIYNRIVAELARRGLGDFTAVQVVIGTLLVLLAFGLWRPDAVVQALVCFAVGGLPMFCGSARRWWYARQLRQ